MKILQLVMVVKPGDYAENHRMVRFEITAFFLRYKVQKIKYIFSKTIMKVAGSLSK